MLPNGTVITPDGRTMIIAETAAARLTAFDIEQDGTLANRRLWAPLQASADGICLDVEGAVWVASPRTDELIRLAEGGTVLQRICTDRSPKACMLGGDDRQTLYVTTAASVVAEECRAIRSGRRPQPLSGA
jgi:sugar lactone lactonase YvrE